MKYMTPELLARYQSEDEGTALRADEQWEEAGERYRVKLQAIRQKLPQPAVNLIDRFCLHDARVLFAVVRPDAVAFVLMLEGDNGGLYLEYKLAEPATLTQHPEIAEGSPLEWLYDELDVLGQDDAPAFVHSILFTDGSELRLAFRSLLWQHYPKEMFVKGSPTRSGMVGGALAELLCA